MLENKPKDLVEALEAGIALTEYGHAIFAWTEQAAVWDVKGQSYKQECRVCTVTRIALGAGVPMEKIVEIENGMYSRDQTCVEIAAALGEQGIETTGPELLEIVTLNDRVTRSGNWRTPEGILRTLKRRKAREATRAR